MQILCLNAWNWPANRNFLLSIRWSLLKLVVVTATAAQIYIGTTALDSNPQYAMVSLILPEKHLQIFALGGKLSAG